MRSNSIERGCAAAWLALPNPLPFRLSRGKIVALECPQSPAKVAVRSWHPLSKLTVFLGLGALTAFWWLDHGAPGDARVAAALPAATATPDAALEAATPAARHAPDPTPTAAPQFDVETRLLPPVDAFTSMVDRPLFAPARRPLDRTVEMAELEVLPRTVEPAAAPSYPSASFVG